MSNNQGSMAIYSKIVGDPLSLVKNNHRCISIIPTLWIFYLYINMLTNQLCEQNKETHWHYLYKKHINIEKQSKTQQSKANHNKIK